MLMTTQLQNLLILVKVVANYALQLYISLLYYAPSPQNSFGCSMSTFMSKKLLFLLSSFIKKVLKASFYG